MSSADRAAARRRKQKAGLNDRLQAEISEIESDLYRAGKVREADIPVQEVKKRNPKGASYRCIILLAST